MTYNQASIYAHNGEILMLPGWHGYFYWNYPKKELNFRDGTYRLTEQLLKDKGVMNRDDWFYII